MTRLIRIAEHQGIKRAAWTSETLHCRGGEAAISYIHRNDADDEKFRGSWGAQHAISGCVRGNTYRLIEEMHRVETIHIVEDRLNSDSCGERRKFSVFLTCGSLYWTLLRGPQFFPCHGPYPMTSAPPHFAPLAALNTTN
jgi:hypothetical protein